MKKYLIALSALLPANSFVEAAIYKMTPDKGQVRFLAKGKPALISIKGEGEGLSSHLVESNKILNGEISFSLASLKTGIALRDDHLKNKYLEVTKYPTATLRVKDLKMTEELEKPFQFAGILSLHGTEQPIEGSALLKEEKGLQSLTAEFKIKLSQFQIAIPSFQGVTVAEEVQLSVDVPVEKEK